MPATADNTILIEGWHDWDNRPRDGGALNCCSITAAFLAVSLTCATVAAVRVARIVRRGRQA